MSECLNVFYCYLIISIHSSPSHNKTKQSELISLLFLFYPLYQDVSTCESVLAIAVGQGAYGARASIESLKGRRAVLEEKASAALAAKDFDEVRQPSLVGGWVGGS